MHAYTHAYAYAHRKSGAKVQKKIDICKYEPQKNGIFVKNVRFFAKIGRFRRFASCEMVQKKGTIVPFLSHWPDSRIALQ